MSELLSIIGLLAAALGAGWWYGVRGSKQHAARDAAKRDYLARRKAKEAQDEVSRMDDAAVIDRLHKHAKR